MSIWYTPKNSIDWLIVYCLSSHSRIFHSYGDVTITGERLQILTYTRRLRPLSSEGSLACHTCCDTGHPFLRSSPRTRDIHTCCRAFGSGTVTTCVNDLGLSRPGFEHPTFRMRGERSTDWATAAANSVLTSKDDYTYLSVTYSIMLTTICSNSCTIACISSTLGCTIAYYVVADRINSSERCKSNRYFKIVGYDEHFRKRSNATL